MKQRKIIFLVEVIIILIIIVTIFFISNTKNKELSQDILFLRLFSNKKDNKEIVEESIQKYIKHQEDEQIESFNFTVDYKNTKMQGKEVELANTISQKMIVKEKIAPRNKRSI